ncbi:NEAT domain-containing protein [Paenibacillus sp. RC67]|uniref:NEAT domain-containing protein n=1 Tax=Paenibacillus sp. RC67 TaxID=3039392 RepID=UPI0024AD7917|nr:NEAT domain-containing protein [Paenibacillus sp. RC67]
MNRQFRKVVSALLMLFVLLSTIQVPVSLAADSQIAKLTTESNSVYPGNTTDFTLAVSGVTQSVYQQVYGSHAVITFNPALLEYVSAAAVNNKLQLAADTSSVSAGQVVVTTSLTNSSQPVSISAADSSLVKLTFKPKAVSQATAASVAASQISIVNGQGKSLLFQDVSTALTVLPAGDTSNPGSELPDGEYKIGYTIYKKNSNEPSMMYDYVDRNSGKLTVQGGKKYVSFTLKQNAEILSFKTEKNGALVETTTVSSDATANTRVVRFEVDDLSARLNGWVKIYWMLPPPIGLYDHEYEVQIGFDPVALEYDMNYTSLHATEDKASTMEKYFGKPGKLKIRQGQRFMSFTITSSSLITSFKVEQNGTLVETTVVSTNKADNKRVVEFPVNDLTQLLKARVHISTVANGSSYEMDHDIRLRFDAGIKTALNTLIANAQAKHDATVEGTANGQYPAGSKGILLEAIRQAKTVLDNVVATQAQVDQAITNLQTALTAFTGSVIVSVEYDLSYSTLHATQDKASTMEKYFGKPGKLKIQQGEKLVSFVIKDSSTIPSFKVEQNGTLVEATTISTDTATNTRVVEFPVYDLTQLLKARVHISTMMPNGTPYEMDHDIRLKLDVGTKSALNTLIADAQAKHDAAVEGTAIGQYPTGSKSTLLTAIQQAKTVAGNVIATQTQVDQAVAELQAALTVFTGSVITNPGSGSGEIPDGSYDIGFTIYKKDSEEPSVMYDYVDKSSGKLTVQGGKKMVSFKLNQSAEILSFKTKQNGALVETTTVSTDKAANTRVVQFEVNDLNAKLDGWVKIYWVLPAPIGIYDHEYDVQIGFSNLPGNPGPSVNKAALNTLLTDAQAKHDAAVEGSANGQYPAGSKSTLQAAINQARAVANDAAATQLQTDKAVADLHSALTAFTASVISNTGSGTWPDGEYSSKFAIFKKGTEEPSVMMDYVDKDSGKVRVKDGKKYVSFKLNKSAEIVYFKTKQNGSLEEVKTVSRDTAANTRVVEFEVSDLTTKLDGWVKIYWVLPEPIGVYDHEYDVDLAFSDFTVDLSKAIPDGQYSFSYTASSLEAGADFNAYAEPTGALKVQSGKKLATLKLKNGATVTKIQQLFSDGSKQDVVPQYAAKQAGIVRVLASDSSTKEVQFEVSDVNGVYLIDLKAGDGSAHTFKLSLNKVSPTGTVDTSNPPSSGGNTGGNTGGGSSGGSGGGVVTNPNALADGKYTMNYSIKKYGTDERSVMQDYVITPGILTVEGGKQYFSFTLKQSKEITDFKTEVGGSLTDTEVLNRDEAKNTRDVQFEVADLSSRLKGWVKVDWKEFNYFHNYDIDITFDKSSAKKVSASTTLGGGGSVVASLKDGEYDLEFKVLQYRNNLESAVNEYISHPGKLIVKDGKRQVALTLNNHSKMTDFKVEKEKMIEATEYEAAKKEIIMESATVASTNEEANQRVVKFDMKDFTKALHAQVEMSEIDEEAAAKQAEAQAQAKQNQSEDEDGYINTLPPVKKELIDVDIMFDIDALGKKTGEETAEQPTDSTEQPTAPTESTNGLKDIQDHWAKTLIERAVSLGIVNGYEDGTFHPDSEVSRAEFTAMIGRALKLEGQKSELNFADADRIPAWVKPTVAQAVNQGIISSYEDQTFRADRKITRSEIAVIITRALKLSDDSKAVLPFADAEEIPQWARAQVTAAVELGMINGRENNRFAPNASATRAEAVTLILAMLNNVKK